MSRSELAWRSLHDLGLATWFGGSVFGSVALAHHPRSTGAEPEETEAAGLLEGEAWQRFSPVLSGAMVAHLVGGAGLIIWNRDRHRYQDGVTATTVAKSAITVAAVALTVTASVQGTKSQRLRRQVEEESAEADGAYELERLERQMRVLGVLIPVATGALVVLGALEGELQRPREIARGLLATARDSVRDHIQDSVQDVGAAVRGSLPTSMAHAIPGSA